MKEFEHLSDKAIELIFNNVRDIELIILQKINAKNAFDVNVAFLENLPNLLDKNEESSWQKASASLDASAKIYGYRVDSVHSETFKFLGGLSRAEAKEGDEDAEGKKERRDKTHHGKHVRNIQIMNQNGYSTLEKDHKKLDLVKYDLEFEVDPLFKSMTAKFNEGNAKGLLLNNLPLDTNLDVLLESKNPNDDSNNKYNTSKKELIDLSMGVREIIDSIK